MNIASRHEPYEAEPQGLAAWLLAHGGDALRLRLARFGTRRPEPRLKLLETLALGGKRQLLLVACDGQTFLVGCGDVSALVPLAANASMTVAAFEPRGHAL